MKSEIRSLSLRSLAIVLLSCASIRAAENLARFDEWILQKNGGGVAKFTKDPAADTLSITIEKATSPFYLIQLAQPLSGPVKDGDRVKLSFRARSKTGNPMRAVIERTGPPYEAVAETRANMSDGWNEYVAASDAVQSYEAGQLTARLQCGHQTGVIEIAALRVENLGPDPTSIAAKAAIEPAAVEARIHKIRTGEMRVEVRDAAGKPVPGANVKIEMTRHEFLFGCNFFGLRPGDSSQGQLDYRHRFTNLFNYATLPFYWGTFERERGKPDYEKLEAMARWCGENGIITKGHPLVWHEVWPRWAPREPDEAIPLLRARVADIVPRYRGLIDIWDILNEANNAADFENGEGRWIKRDGPASVVATALGWGREAAGTNRATFIYNDYNVGPDNEQLIAALEKKNAMPDAIGLQSHMHDHIWPLLRVWRTCERYAKFNRPIHFTELTVVSSTKKPGAYDAKRGEWPTTPEGEAIQAAYLEKFYPLLFSHPSVQAITWWDFSDLRAWRNAPSGLVRDDMSPKPAYEKLHALIREKWWTRVQGKTDASGVFVTRGFQGVHRVEVLTDDGRRGAAELRLPTGQSGTIMTIRL